MTDEIDGAWFEHYQDVPPALWRWPHFTPEEIACRGTDQLLVCVPYLDTLEKARVIYDKPMHMTSVYRSESHNVHVGGAPLSEHVLAHAGDITVSTSDRDQLLDACIRAGFRGFGFYRTFLHADIGRKRTWGSWN